MSSESVMHREVPFVSIFAKIFRIPPVFVEYPVPEVSNFRTNIGHQVESHIKHDESVVENRDAYFQHSLHDIKKVAFHSNVDGVSQRRFDVLFAYDSKKYSAEQKLY